MSPGTSSVAGHTIRLPLRRTVATSAWYAPSSSIAFAAFVSVITPTRAFAIRMNTMTLGSISEYMPSLFASPRIRDVSAAATRIFTSKSSNCFQTSFQNDGPGPQGNSFLPHALLNLHTSSILKPSMAFTPSWTQICSGNKVKLFSAREFRAVRSKVN